MTTIIVGGTAAGPTPTGKAETAGNSVSWAPSGETEPGTVASLAEALTAFEAEVSGQQIDSIVLVDDSDTALAAALVGTKLPVDVLATEAARDASTVNGLLIAQLADAYTAPA